MTLDAQVHPWLVEQYAPNELTRLRRELDARAAEGL